MPTDEIPIDLIWVKRDERQRRKLEPDPYLQSSIKRVGLINPLIVKKDFQLVAGERRYEACKAIGKASVPVRWFEDLSTDEASLIELEENIKRKELTWQDLTLAIAEYHRVHIKLDPEWNQRRSAEALSLDPGHVSTTLLVAAHMKDQRVANATNQTEARNLIRRRNERANDAELNSLAEHARTLFAQAAQPQVGMPNGGPSLVPPLEAAPPPAVWSAEAVRNTILEANFLEWVREYKGRPFNFIHCDFPYGVNVFDGSGYFKTEDMESYADDPDVFWTLTEALVKHADKLMSASAHLIFWLTPKPQVMMRSLQMLTSISNLQFYPYPLVWHKSDLTGIVGDSQRWPRHTYEAALFAYRGKRPLIHTVPDSYSGPGDRKLHPATKPEPMLRHFFSSLVDEHTRLFDPTCGSGAALRAAESLGAKPENVLGLEMEPRFVQNARDALHHARLNATAHVLAKASEVI